MSTAFGHTLVHAYHDCVIVHPLWIHLHRRLSRHTTRSQPSASELFSLSYAPRTGKERPGVLLAIACALWVTYRTHTMAFAEGKMLSSQDLIRMWQEQVGEIIHAKRRTSVKMNTVARFTRRWQWLAQAVGRPLPESV